MDETNNKYQIPVMLGLAAFTAILSIPEFPLPPGLRQAELLYKGWAVLEGQLPYKDFWDNGSPGVFYIYALALKLFGHRYESINILDIIWRSGTAVALYLLTKRFFGRLEGIIAAVLYAIALAIVGSFWQWNALPESFLLLPLALGLYFYLDDNHIGANVLSGLLLGIASIIKLPVFLLVVMLGAFAILTPRETWEPRPRRAKMFSFLYGVIVAFIFLIFYLLLSWSITDFFREVILYNIHFPKALDPLQTIIIYFYILIPFLPVMFIRQAENKYKWFISGLLLVSIIMLYINRMYDVNSYWAGCFFTMLGPAIIMASNGMASAVKFAMNENFALGSRIISSLLALIWLASPGIYAPYFYSKTPPWNKYAIKYLSRNTDVKQYFSSFERDTPVQIEPGKFVPGHIYYSTDFEIASYIEKHTKPEDVVIGFPFINFLSKRVDPGGFEPIWNLPADENARTQIIIKNYNNKWKKRSNTAYDVYMVVYNSQIKRLPAEKQANYLGVKDCNACNCNCATQFVFSDGSIVCRFCRK